MFCVKCGYTTTRIINSRQRPKSLSVWRRRQCSKCRYVFTTYESVALDQILVLDKDDKQRAFSHTKLLISLYKCFEHASDKRVQYIEDLTRTIENKILENGATTSPREICEISFSVLKNFDRLASIQYAAQHAEILKSKLKN